MTKLTANKSSSLNGTLNVPGDKSISHRSIILGGLAIGETIVNGLLESEDVLYTISAMRGFGAIITKKNTNEWSIYGRGISGLDEPDHALYLGNSGTGVRLLMGLAASNPINTFFIGDESLSRRPMKRVSIPLEMMGAKFISRNGGCLPIVCSGPKYISSIQYKLPVPSAQVKSAILLAALGAAGKTTILEPEPTRNHTELMLQKFGATVKVKEANGGGREITITGQPELTGQKIIVPADPSSAAFPTVATLITKDSEINLVNVCTNPLRFGLFEILSKMGAKIEYTHKNTEGNESVSDIKIKSSELVGIDVPAEIAPRMIDEYPILAIAAAFADGKTVMNGLNELRVKESDRLTAISAGLQACGVTVEETDDSLTVHGKGGFVEGGALIKANMDHRIAMAFLVLGMGSDKPVEIDNASTIDTSFPEFYETMSILGANLVRTKPDGKGCNP
jgi:3-phosphoshikimate 1-carboxyvinyltransferase